MTPAGRMSLFGAILLGLGAGPVPAPAAPDEEGAIHDLIARDEQAIGSQDVEMFRSVMPALSEDEVGRLKRSFESIRTHAVEITVVSIEVDPPLGRVALRRRDVLNAGTASEVATAFSQVLELVRESGIWRIRSIER